jgi:translocation and assembly module TamB
LKYISKNKAVQIKKVIKSITKAIMFLLLFVLLVLGVTYFHLNTDAGKRLVTKKVQSYVAQKLKTKFTIGSVNYHLPNNITISKIYLPSANNDSLLYAGELTVSISLFKLIKGETEIKNVELKHAVVHILRKDKDSNFNFQFVIDAFASKQSKPIIKDTAELKLNLNRIVLNHVVMKFDDYYSGSFIYARVVSSSRRYWHSLRFKNIVDSF